MASLSCRGVLLARAPLVAASGICLASSALAVAANLSTPVWLSQAVFSTMLGLAFLATLVTCLLLIAAGRVRAKIIGVLGLPCVPLTLGLPPMPGTNGILYNGLAFTFGQFVVPAVGLASSATAFKEAKSQSEPMPLHR